eukprot:840506-Rhodomonas_salina.2
MQLLQFLTPPVRAELWLALHVVGTVAVGLEAEICSAEGQQRPGSCGCACIPRQTATLPRHLRTLTSFQCAFQRLELIWKRAAHGGPFPISVQGVPSESTSPLQNAHVGCGPLARSGSS